MNYKEKNKLDLEYTNLLNWRSIVFGFYFALLGLSVAYFSSLFKSNLLNFSLIGPMIAILLWVVIDHFKYREIRNRLEQIENEIRKIE